MQFFIRLLTIRRVKAAGSGEGFAMTPDIPYFRQVVGCLEMAGEDTLG
ncbi:MAG: hypothetical protein RQ936_03965 [Gammaproteobacteria bacterium]|nr:hypothetical protein [Gammaproteobacteria bacterium]